MSAFSPRIRSETDAFAYSVSALAYHRRSSDRCPHPQSVAPFSWWIRLASPQNQKLRLLPSLLQVQRVPALFFISWAASSLSQPFSQVLRPLSCRQCEHRHEAPGDARYEMTSIQSSKRRKRNLDNGDNAQFAICPRSP
jgi:hypothetical protein